ncbi:MAG TPA: transcriptional regulator FtrA [Gemmatimonadales bacterium]|nr:transcriptional regulator FtrA [Gemmatimonadales bacterium]
MPRNTFQRVTALVYDRLCSFEFGIVVEIFALPRPELPVEWYQFSLCSLDAGPLRATGGLRIQARRTLGRLREADTIVIPGWRDPDEVPPTSLLRALRRAHDRGARLVAICSGAFVLAAAGLLDGRRATTHWHYAEKLRARYPKVEVVPNVLYVDEGSVLTSAGSAAGIDLCLHVVRRDYGAEIANRVARRLVMPPHRDGGQAQYVAEPVSTRPNGGLSKALDWALARLDRPLSLDDLARQANMSVRTLARRFVQETGSTPHRWVTHQRLLAAQRRLETTDDSIDQVAEAVGFDTAMTLRHHFRRTFGTTPTRYRQRFSVHTRPQPPEGDRP